MKKYNLDPLSAAHALTVMVLEKVHLTFYRMHRAKEAQYNLGHGTINGA